MLETATDATSLLWEVTGNNLGHPSYFLGTMHLMCTEDAILSGSTKTIIQLVEQIYLEVDLNDIGSLRNGAFSIAMPEGTTLYNLLEHDDYEKVRGFFEEHQPDVPFSILEQQQPLMLSSSLYELFLPCESKNGIDACIVEEANKLNKEIKGLETLAFQGNLLNTISYKEQARELLKTIDNLAGYEAYLKQVVALYKTQDIKQLHLLTTREEGGISAYTDLLVYKRNKDWVQIFPLVANDTATLFAVGAGHLGGEEGVINLLKKEGYKLRPLKN